MAGPNVLIPNHPDTLHLKNELDKAGYISIHQAKTLYPGVKVKGEAPYTWQAWFDNLKQSTMTSKSTWKGKVVRCLMI